MSDDNDRVRKAREADYIFWLRKPQWNPPEAAILLAGYEPEAFPDGSLDYESLAEDVDGIHRLIIESINSKDIAVVNSPTDWIEWAKWQNLTLPPALVKTGASSSSAGGGVTDTSDDVTPVGAGDTPSKVVGMVWWGVAKDEGNKWYARKLREKKADEVPIEKNHLADYLYQWLFDKGYRGRGNHRISKSSILEQITGIVKRTKTGMYWK